MTDGRVIQVVPRARKLFLSIARDYSSAVPSLLAIAESQLGLLGQLLRSRSREIGEGVFVGPHSESSCRSNFFFYQRPATR